MPSFSPARKMLCADFPPPKCGDFQPRPARNRGQDGGMHCDPTSDRTATRSRVKRPSLSPKQRARIIAKSQGFCVYCGCNELSNERLQIDHFIPLSRGGVNQARNLVAACQSCNAEKGDMLAEEYRAYLCALLKQSSHLFDYENSCYGVEIGLLSNDDLERVLSRHELRMSARAVE